MSTSAVYFDTLRLSDTERQAVVDELDRQDAIASGGRRTEPRWKYHVPEGILVHFQHAAAYEFQFRVIPRNISSAGLGLLHGGFVYSGTRCVARLRTIDREFVLAAGVVVHCRCVRGRIHEVGVKFDEPIDIENFVVLDRSGRHRADSAASRSARPGAGVEPAPEAASPAPPTPEPAADSGAARSKEPRPSEAVARLMHEMQVLAAGGAPASALWRKAAELTDTLLAERVAAAAPDDPPAPQDGRPNPGARAP